MNQSTDTESAACIASVNVNMDLNHYPKAAQPSLPDNNSESSAVLVRNLCKGYGRNGPRILDNFCLNVRKRTIYGLLGSSGCGKTTALSCIVGLKKWESGEILVFGERPGTRGSGMLGKRLGYVPQDTALYEHLTIKENIQYYGRLYGMSEDAISEQWKNLEKLLQFPSESKVVKHLSGGQKRRTSLALSLVHKPQLLIMDEPTVGLDPLLRESVWNHLYNLVQTHGTTIIITTHYIEETRNADMIGILRDGRLLAEESPAALMLKHNTDLLEHVVLNLCYAEKRKVEGFTITTDARNNDNTSNNTITALNHDGSNLFQSKWTPNIVNFEENCSSWGTYNQGVQFDSFSPDNNNGVVTNDKKGLIRNSYNNRTKGWCRDAIVFAQRAWACCYVIYWNMIRHPVVLICALGLPAFEVLLTVACIGAEPRGLAMGIINEEVPDWISRCAHEFNASNIHDERHHCELNELSCKYLHTLEKRDIIKLVPYDSVEKAVEQVRVGNLWGYLHFRKNYSQHMIDRLATKQFAFDESIIGSTITVRMDQSHYLGFMIIYEQLLLGLQQYVYQLANSCDLEARQTEIPFKYRTPVYGSLDDGYHSHVVPGVLANIMFFMPMCISALLFINDLKMGTLSRARVAGLQTVELMTAHAITQGTMTVVQIIICTVSLKLGFNFQIAGSTFAYIGITFLIGMCGQAFGIFIGIFTQDEVEALIIGIFILPTMLMFGGVIWPLDCMRPFFKYIGLSMPTTLIAESLRSTATRAVGFTHLLMWPGIAITAGWLVLFWIISLVAYRVCIK